MREGQRTPRGRSPTPGACAPTGCRTSPTPTATDRSLRKLFYAQLPGSATPGSRAATACLREPEPRRAAGPTLTAQAAAGLPEGSRLHALTRHHRLPRPDLLPAGASTSPSPPASIPGHGSSPRPRRPAQRLIPPGLPYSRPGGGEDDGRIKGRWRFVSGTVSRPPGGRAAGGGPGGRRGKRIARAPPGPLGGPGHRGGGGGGRVRCRRGGPGCFPRPPRPGPGSRGRPRRRRPR